MPPPVDLNAVSLVRPLVAAFRLVFAPMNSRPAASPPQRMDRDRTLGLRLVFRWRPEK